MSSEKSSPSTDRTVLGIDLGTTSVKVCIVKHAKVLATCTKPTEATGDIPSEQNVLKIIKTLENCILSLPPDIVSNVNHIGVCGQMHGVCLWKYQSRNEISKNTDNPNTFPLFELYNGDRRVSTLYTWMDQRCDSEFLNSLPTPDSHLRLSTGHGCATLFWLSRNSPEILKGYDSAGTIMDFLVAVLCYLQNPVISIQNAASWGYYNTDKKEWNYDILKNADFPVQLLPNISAVDSDRAGQLCSDWLGIKAGTPVGPALGDLQCGVYSTFLDKDSAFINISTSAQIAYQSPALPTISGKLEYFPYFRNQYLAVGASLNGGNVLHAFVNSIIKFGQEFGVVLNEDSVWTTILSSAENVHATATDLLVIPTLFGERHFPKGRASVSNISPNNMTIANLTKAIIQGLVKNLADFVGIKELENVGVTKIMAGGSALLRNPIFKEELQRAYPQFKLIFTDSDSAYGAALYFMDQN